MTDETKHYFRREVEGKDHVQQLAICCRNSCDCRALCRFEANLMIVAIDEGIDIDAYLWRFVEPKPLGTQQQIENEEQMLPSQLF